MDDALQPPPGGRQNRGTAFLIVVLVFTVLAWVFVTPRIYIRAFVKRVIGWDDAFIVLSLILATISTAFTVPDVVAGYGQHLFYLSHHQPSEALKWSYLATPLTLFSLATSKISICFLLLQLLEQTQTPFKRFFPIVIIAILTIIAITCAGYSLGQCQPVSKLWNTATPGHCKDPAIYVKLGYTNGTINAFCDFALALYPLTFIHRLHVGVTKKIVLGLLMSCGVVCGALAITRTVLTSHLTARSDWTYDSFRSSLPTIIEENLSIMVACVPTLGRLFAVFDSKLRSLKFRRHHTPIADGTRPSPMTKTPPPPIFLGPMNVNSGPFNQSSAEAVQRPYAVYHYGHDVSNISLVPMIRKTTTVEVERGLGYV